MAQLPKISIITAVFNGEQHISKTIESVLGQTYSNLEYIVIDGGSTDKTAEIIKSYGSKIHCFLSERDQGIYDALNKGIALAKGDIIGLLHADDLFAKNSTLSLIAKQFVETQADGVYSDLIYFKKINEIERQTIRYWKSEPFSRNLLMQGWMPPHPTLYLKKAVFQNVGSYDLGYPIAADYDFILRLFQSADFKFSYLPEVTVLMQVGGVSNRNLRKILEKSSQDFEILKKHGFPATSTLIKKNFSKLKQFLSRTSL